MKAEFTAIIEPAPEGGTGLFVRKCPAQTDKAKRSKEVKENLRQAIELVLEVRRADILRGLPEDAIQDKVLIG